MAGEASSLAEVEKEKLRTWCQSTGVENASDLAFYFTSFDQALEQAGRVVASAWLDARADTSRGLPVLVRSLFHGEAVPQGRPTPSSATPSRASTAAAAAPAEVPQPSRAASRVSPERAAAVGHTHQLLAVLLGFAPAAPMMSTAARAYLALLAETVCKQFDSATIQRVITTCREVQTAVAAAGLPGPDAHFFASFVRTHSSPKRVFDDLCWSVRHLQFSWDLQLVDPPSPSSSCHGTKRLKTQPALPESRVTTPEPVTRIWHAWASGTLPREPSILQRVQMGVFLGFFRNQERPAWSAHHWMRLLQHQQHWREALEQRRLPDEYGANNAGSAEADHLSRRPPEPQFPPSGRGSNSLRPPEPEFPPSLRTSSRPPEPQFPPSGRRV